MIILIPILLLLVVPLLMFAVRLLRPRFASYWLLAAGATLLAWLLVLLSRLRLPLSIPLGSWRPAALFPISPLLLIDDISWPFVLALVTLLLAMILTDVVRTYQDTILPPRWSDWASSMVLTALGLLAVLAGNLLTLLLAWAAVDLIEAAIWMVKVQESEQSEQVVMAYTGRIASLGIVIWAAMVTRSAGAALSFPNIPPQASLSLLLAAVLRLGFFPRNLPRLKVFPISRGLGTILQLVPAATGLVLVTRLGVVGVTPNLIPYLVILLGLIGLYTGVTWILARNESEGQSAWTMGMASLALAAGVQGQQDASLAWSMALLFSGGLIQFFFDRHRLLLPVMALGLLGFSSLPYTPSWSGVFLYTNLPIVAAPFFLLTQAALLVGYLRHSLRPTPTLDRLERWMWIYPWGLILLTLTQYAVAWWTRPSSIGSTELPLTLLESWPAFAAVILAVLLLLLSRRGPWISPRLLVTLRASSPAAWLYRRLWNLYTSLGHLLAFVSAVLEGQAGVLWALLLITLLVSLLTQFSLGG